MPRGYDFTSPGAAGADALQAFLIQRALQQRQQQEDALKKQQADAQIQRQIEESQRQDAELKLRQAMEQRVGVAQGRELDIKDEATRAARNEQGVRGMIADRLGSGVPIAGPEAQTISNMAYREGVPVPGVIATAMQPPKRTTVKTVDAKERPIEQAVTEEQLIAGVPQYQEPKADAGEPLVAIMGADGQPTLVPRSQAVGKRPASTREQGRPVMASDAGRIAELDTSLNDVDTLSKQLGTTGAGSALGAALPNVITEYTGIGEVAKQRQAVINRVKQVIGKALEGGVLRKEDEEKYSKILPTIGDPPDVAATKLTGLKAALVQRRQTLIDALSDANFDTSKFTERQRAEPATKPTAKDLIKKYGR